MLALLQSERTKAEVEGSPLFPFGRRLFFVQVELVSQIGAPIIWSQPAKVGLTSKTCVANSVTQNIGGQFGSKF